MVPGKSVLVVSGLFLGIFMVPGKSKLGSYRVFLWYQENQKINAQPTFFRKMRSELIKSVIFEFPIVNFLRKFLSLRDSIIGYFYGTRKIKNV